MTHLDVLEMQNMFTIAAQIAKSKNKRSIHLNLDETAIIEILKKAFPSIKDEQHIIRMAKDML